MFDDYLELAKIMREIEIEDEKARTVVLSSRSIKNSNLLELKKKYAIPWQWQQWWQSREALPTGSFDCISCSAGALSII